MKILAVSQVYFPDTASVSQHLTDLLERLASHGHEVTVFTSVREYERPNVLYTGHDEVNGVKIYRLKNTAQAIPR